MRQNKSNFSKDPLVLACGFDPRELFYFAGFDDYKIQWSYDNESTLKAFENFIDGNNANVEGNFSVQEILLKDPVVIVKYDKKSFECLTKLVKNQTPEAVLKNLLGVNKVLISVEGLSLEVDRQLSRWNLSIDEKEVALLLLQGLNLKKIAEIRDISEKTARAQSSAVYLKSGLTKRSELSAFFSEDPLLPKTKS